MGSKTSVRRATQADLDALVPLFDAYRSFYGVTEREGSREFLAARLAGNESFVFLATVDDQPAGFTQLYPSFSSVRMKPLLILNDLFVDADHRRLGVANALMQAAEDFARQQGAGGLTLETDADNTSAQALYEARGWRLDGRKHYEKGTGNREQGTDRGLLPD